MSLFTKRSEAKTLEELHDEWKDCKQCPFYAQRNNVVIGAGNPTTAKIYVAGQAPAEEEDQCGIPFSGPGGMLCRDLFKQWRIPEEEIFWSNALACKTFKGAKIRRDWMNNCWERVEAELRIVQPKIIVTLGRPASERFCNSLPSKGEFRETKFNYEGIPGVTAVHPAILLRKKGRDKKKWQKIIDSDFELICELYDNFCI